jgi:lysozyme
MAFWNKVKSKPTAITGAAAAIALALPLVGEFEGLRTVAYLDIVNVPTVCFGETKGVKLGDEYSVDQCNAMLAGRLVEFEDKIKACVPSYAALPARTQAALISLSYNIGSGGFCGSTLVKKLNAGDIEGACNQFPRWNRAGGKVVRGLTIRRAKEQALCLEGIE